MKNGNLIESWSNTHAQKIYISNSNEVRILNTLDVSIKLYTKIEKTVYFKYSVIKKPKYGLSVWKQGRKLVGENLLWPNLGFV